MSIFCDISEVEKGMEVRIAEDVQESIYAYGGSHGKRKLAGTIQTIHTVRPGSNSVRIICKEKKRWHFMIGDIRKLGPPILLKPPEIFDPNQLDLD